MLALIEEGHLTVDTVGDQRSSTARVGCGYALRPAVVAQHSLALPALRSSYATVLEVISPFMPTRHRERTSKAERAFEATLLALVVSLALGGLLAIPNPDGIKIGLRRNAYSKSGISHDYLCQILDAMKRAGLITMRNGYRDETGKGKVSRIIPLPALLALLEASGVKLIELRTPPANVLLLRKAPWSEPPEQVMANSDLIRRLNKRNAEHELRLPNEVRNRVIQRLSSGYYYDAKTGKLRQLRGGWDDSLIFLIRIFTGSWETGGRLYGGYWQNTPHEERVYFLIDGEATVERDFSTLHPRMLFAMEGVTGELNIDPYVVPGFNVERGYGKTTFARLLNGRFREAAVKQPWREIHPLRFNADDKAVFGSREEFRAYVSAMRGQLHIIEKHFGKGFGLELQKRDSDLALAVVQRFVEKGMPIYPIHDSFIVRKEDESFLMTCMSDSLIESFS